MYIYSDRIQKNYSLKTMYYLVQLNSIMQSYFDDTDYFVVLIKEIVTMNTMLNCENVQLIV